MYDEWTVLVTKILKLPIADAQAEKKFNYNLL